MMIEMRKRTPRGISVVIPTYNERRNIKILIPMIGSFLNNVCPYEIIVVDDDSPDGTWLEAKKFEKKYNVVVIRRVGKRGLVSAILEGIARANYERIVVMDADLQHPPKLIVEMYKRLNHADIVIASRYMQGGKIEGWSLFRLLVSRVASLMAYILFPKVRRISDPMSGFFGLHKNILVGVKINAIGFKVLLEIIVKGKYRNIEEIPYTFKSRLYGKSKLSSKIIWQYIKHIAILATQTKRLTIITYIVLLLVLYVALILIAL